MTYLCLILDAHQPVRLNKAFPYERARRLAEGASVIDRYFDDKLSQDVFTALSKRCYGPLFDMLLKMIEETKGTRCPFKAALNLSGPFLEQAVRYDPGIANLVKKLTETKMIEIICGTRFRSLASLNSSDRSEFVEQVKAQREYIRRLFDVDTRVFGNTGYIYNDSIGKIVEEMGFAGLLTEGADRIFTDRSPNYLFFSRGAGGLKMLFRHRRLADDISVNFFRTNWSEYPLTAEKYASWLSSAGGDVISIVLSVEALTDAQASFSNILKFLEHLPNVVASKDNLEWATPSEAVEICSASGTILVPETDTISWAGERKDASLWLGNAMQRISFDRIASLKPYVAEVNDDNITKIWRLLQQSDYIQLMSMMEEGLRDGHVFYNPYSSPAEAYAVFDSIFTDFEGKIATIVNRIRIAKTLKPTPQPTRPSVSPNLAHYRHSGY